MKFGFVSILLFFFAIVCFAQENPEGTEVKSTRFSHGLGVAGGATSAYGLSYRLHVERLGIFITYAPLKVDNRSQHNLGFGLLYNLIEGQKANLFLYQSNYYFRESETYDTHDPQTGKKEEKEYVNSHMNHGLGLGMEFIIAKVVGLNIMAGYGAYNDFEEIGITLEGGLYYKF
jgi:hypothetical protein